MSSFRKYASGANKRKVVEKREVEKKKIPKIDSFFQKKAATLDIEIPSTSTSSTTAIEESTEFDAISATKELVYDSEIKDGDELLFEFNELTTSSDIGLFLNVTLDDSLKRQLVNIGPHRPLGPFPKDTLSRSFSSNYYKRRTATGQDLERIWIAYSEKLNGAYCHSCWLFADRSNPSFSAAWTTGTLNDWQGLSKKISAHEKSRIHLEACLVYSTWKDNKTFDSFLKDNRDILKNVLKRLIDITRTMAICNLPFRGHRDTISDYKNKLELDPDPSEGVFLNIVKLLAIYDPVLEMHFSNMQKIRNHYLSNRSQNIFIALISDTIQKSIVEDIKKSPFFSLIVDTTQDISKKDQLSLVIRYINTKNNKKYTVAESFLGFFEMMGQRATDFEDEILSFLEQQGISLSKCRGQGYDGAANMSGKYSGLQALIKKRQSNADHIHCTAHSLNLILNDSVNNIIEIRNLFDTIQCLYVFFSESLPRWQSLNNEIKDSGTVKLTLKKLCPTRWSSRADSIISLKTNYLAVVKCLSNLSVVVKKKSDRDEAKALLKKIENLQPDSPTLVRSNLTTKSFKLTTERIRQLNFIL